VGGGFFDEFGLGGLGFGEVEARDLDGGDALEDLADDKLNA
jgi:hypothetical protein